MSPLQPWSKKALATPPTAVLGSRIYMVPILQAWKIQGFKGHKDLCQHFRRGQAMCGRVRFTTGRFVRPLYKPKVNPKCMTTPTCWNVRDTGYLQRKAGPREATSVAGNRAVEWGQPKPSEAHKSLRCQTWSCWAFYLPSGFSLFVFACHVSIPPFCHCRLKVNFTISLWGAN